MDIRKLRKEASEKGGLPLIQFDAWRLILPLFSLLLVALIALLIFGSIPRKETVNGILALSRGQIKIIPPKAGTLVAVYVSEGEEVKPGQVLVRISTAEENDKGTTNEQVLTSIKSQLAALQQRVIATKKEYSTQSSALSGHIKSEVRQLSILKQQWPALKRKLDLQKDTLDSGQTLASQGVISLLQLRSFESNYLDQENANSEYLSKIEQLSDSLAQDRAAAVKLPADSNNAVEALLQQIAALQQAYITAAGESEYVLKAKFKGKISLLQTTLGASVDASQPVAVIVPSSNELYAAIYVPSRAIGFVKPGQQVRLMYDSYPYQKFGLGHGVITHVSSTVLMPTEVKGNTQLNEPSYLVDVKLSEDKVNAFGRSYYLQSDMTLSADIILEQQSLYKLLLEPFLAAGSRG